MSAAPKWQAGKLYLPGDLVQPVTTAAPSAAQVANGSFESGATGWDFEAPVAYAATGGYSGPGNCTIASGAAVEGVALNQTHLVVPVGESLTARCMIHQGASDVDHTRGWVVIRWFNASDVQIGAVAKGNVVNDGRGGAWHESTVSSTAPAGAAYARAGIGLYQNSSDPVNGDALSVAGAYSGTPEGLLYKAVQPAAGTSGASEPAWPGVLGQQVIDNEVTWEAVSTARVVWEASHAMTSGATEPVWPTQPGGFVVDGDMQWEAVSRRIEDENCPNTKEVVIAAGKVYAADDDIIRYCATVNPLDWSSANDAGYLPFGLQQYGANPVAAMGLYRSNLVAFNSEAFQMWQVDENPANSALLDALPIGSNQHKALAPVSNDLFFLSAQGVRTVGIAGASTNLQAGDVGMPIDPLVQARMLAAAASGEKPLATYYPGAGQYWLAFNFEVPSA